jgi:salicylate hydroxylase
MADELPILIAGAGIGGLAATVALGRAGRPVHVVERREATAEEGAGIQLGPNAVRALRRLGVADEVEAVAGRPVAVHVRNGRSGRTLARLPLGAWMAERHGAPYFTVRRSDLHGALLAAASALPRVALTAGFEVAAVDQIGDGVAISDVGGRRLRGAVLIGADGVGSAVARLGLGARPARFLGKTAARCLAEPDRLPAVFGENEIGLWLGPKAHLVHYPVAGGALVNIVAIVDGDWQGEEWGAAVTAAEVDVAFTRWHDDVRDCISEDAEWRRWALRERAPLRAWARGRVALLGDAAQPVLPFLAQGGALALEQATSLAAALAGAPGDLPGALQAYGARSRARAAAVARASSRNGRLYHLAGPVGLVRDVALRAAPGSWLLRRYDWLYGHEANE